MDKVMGLLYIASGFYVVYIFVSTGSYLFKKVPFKKTLSIMSQKKYAWIILAAVLIICPLDFYFSCSKIIPERSYPVTLILNIQDDPKEKVVVAAEIYYYEDIDRLAEPQDLDYLKKSSPFINTFLNRTFWLSVFNYDYYIEDIPETIVSGYTYEVTVSLPDNRQGEDSDFYRATGTIEIPVFTSQSLGITALDQLGSMSVIRYIDHLIVFILALLGLIICLPRKKSQT